MSDITNIPEAARKSDRRAGGQLLTLVYDELRRLAAAKMAQKAPGHTLQPTALVYEAWLWLVGNENRSWDARAHRDHRGAVRLEARSSVTEIRSSARDTKTAPPTASSSPKRRPRTLKRRS